jgi:hypothetical protein
MSQRVEMEGALRLEGAFLEKVFAAHALSRGLRVIPRPETEGKQHDVLLEQYNGFIYCECTGLAEITGSKIERFYSDTIELHDKVSKKYGKGVLEAWFIAASMEDAWTTEASERFQKVKALLKEKFGVEVRLLSSNELLLELLKSGVLGIRLVRDKVYWASPEDLAIRYNPKQKLFVYDRCDEHVLNELRRTHFSLLPSFYWDSYYRVVFEEAVKDKAELPLSVFSYYPTEGLQWRSLTDLVDCYAAYLNHFSRTYVLEKGRDFILEVHTSKRGHDYYTLHIFTLGEQKASEAKYVSSTLVSTLKGRAYLTIEDLKKAGKIPKVERIGIHIVSSTQYWTPQAWGEAPEIPDVLKEELYITYHKPGDELLQDLLNTGILGFRFKGKNQVTLVGPGVEGVRLSLGELLLKT